MLSALALAPLPIAAVWFGSPWLPILTAAAAAVMAWEWGRLCRRGRFGAAEVMLVGTVVAIVATAALAGSEWAMAVALAGAGLVFWAANEEAEGEARWTAAGVLWVGLPCVAWLWLAQSEGRPATLLWILALVWATDIGAYAVGRLVGGPRLAPRWSPHKTWSGLIGGLLSAGLAGWLTAISLGISPALPLMLTSAALAIVEQFGDLAESMAKRRFGVKDSSGLIPGHGGLLDLLGGRSVLLWR